MLNHEQVLVNAYDSTTGGLNVVLADLTDNSNRYYSDNTASLTFAQTALSFGFKSHSIFIENEGTEPLYFSFDGINIHGRIAVNIGKAYDFRYEENIWFRCDTDGGAYYFIEVY